MIKDLWLVGQPSGLHTYVWIFWHRVNFFFHSADSEKVYIICIFALVPMISNLISRLNSTIAVFTCSIIRKIIFFIFLKLSHFSSMFFFYLIFFILLLPLVIAFSSYFCIRYSFFLIFQILCHFPFMPLCISCFSCAHILNQLSLSFFHHNYCIFSLFFYSKSEFL